MKKHIRFFVTTIALMFFSNVNFSQTLELLSLDSFEAYTGVGAVSNRGQFTGDAGTNDGIISGTGFNPANGYTGTTYNNDATTILARIDMHRVYIHLSDIFVTHSGAHAPSFGGGETISPGVYYTGSAGSIAGTLILDGGGDPDAFFIMKFEGALTIGASSTIVLSGGTRAANVFWIAEGPISVGYQCVINGTLLSHPGAVTLGANSTIEGRLLTSEGAITIEAGSVATMPSGSSTIPINCLGNCAPNPVVDVLGTIEKFALFTSNGAVANTGTSAVVGSIGTNFGAISGLTTSPHVGYLHDTDAVSAQGVIDLEHAYSQLIDIPNTEFGHAPAFGSGETLFPGVYFIVGAGSLAGTITLDAQGDHNAIFVFKFNGAFSVAAQSKVIFTNGTHRCNVFWITEGAISMGAFTKMKGTLLAHNGACTMGANGNFRGKNALYSRSNWV